jgi:hypothetical protein
VAGALTEIYLTPETRASVRALIGDESLSSASTWADRMRSDPSPFWQRQAGPWHYVTVPPGKTYSDVKAPTRGDAMSALRRFRKTLRDPNARRTDKQLALRFALHIIQDLHQPLHVGNGRDRGGNDVAVSLAGETTNLHRVWDTAILAQARRSDRAWIKRLGNIDRSAVSTWGGQGPASWIEESARLRDRLYPRRSTLDETYLQNWLPTVERRLQQAAVRGAAWCNEVL